MLHNVKKNNTGIFEVHVHVSSFQIHIHTRTVADQFQMYKRASTDNMVIDACTFGKPNY